MICCRRRSCGCRPRPTGCPGTRTPLKSCGPPRKKNTGGLLYVALTRAEDRLIVCGWEPKRGAHDDCWYAMVSRALKPERPRADGRKRRRDRVALAEGSGGCRDRRAGRARRTGRRGAPGDGEPAGLADGRRSVPCPGKSACSPRRLSRPWRTRTASSPCPHRRGLRKHGREPSSWPLGRVAVWSTGFWNSCPDLPAADRMAAARAYLEQALKPEFARLMHETACCKRWARSCRRPNLRRCSRPGNDRAEVPLVGTIRASDGSVKWTISGQIDRLLVEDNRVVIVDYKTNLHPPGTCRRCSRWTTAHSFAFTGNC